MHASPHSQTILKILKDLLFDAKLKNLKIKEELKKHLVDVFESVRAIINANGVKIEKIEFLETVSSGI